jgi:circadian clock protein KaiC
MIERDELASASLERMPTGVPGLDQILEGGLFVGGVYMLLAPPGSGKTILGNQICFHHVAGGGRAVYVTLLTESHARLLASIQQLDFFAAQQVGDSLKYFTAYQALEQEDLKGLLLVLKQIVREHKATLLCIDGLVVTGTGEKADVEKKKFIHELQVYVELVGCTTLLLTGANDHAEEYAVRTMIDGLIELRQVRVGMAQARTLEVSKFRGSGVNMGRHVFEISSRGIEVYPRLESYLGTGLGQTAPRTGPTAKSGFAAFDAMLDGGLPGGTVTMIHGAPGSGKTLLGMSFLAEGARLGERGLYFGFFETPAELVAKTEAIGLPTSDMLSKELLDIAWHAPFDVLADKLAHQLLTLATTRNVKRVFIDGMRGFHQSVVQPERSRVFVAALANELRARGIVALFSEEKHHLADDELPEHGLASSLDNIVFLQHVRGDVRLHKIISIVKMRNAPHEATMREYFIDGRGFHMVGGAPKPVAKKVVGKKAVGKKKVVATKIGKARSRRR